MSLGTKVTMFFVFFVRCVHAYLLTYLLTKSGVKRNYTVLQVLFWFLLWHAEWIQPQG